MNRMSEGTKKLLHETLDKLVAASEERDDDFGMLDLQLKFFQVTEEPEIEGVAGHVTENLRIYDAEVIEDSEGHAFIESTTFGLRTYVDSKETFAQDIELIIE